MKHRNHFDLLRLIAAALVVVGHGYALAGLPAPAIFSVSTSSLGVSIFFAISGYLIAGSWEREPVFVPFFIKRALRLFPALIVLVLVTMLLFGPVVSTLPVRDYFADPATLNYLHNLRLYIVFYLPGVFTANPIPNAVNGSLWSLPVEFFCYLAVPVAGVLAVRFRVFAYVLLAALLAALSTYSVLFKADRMYVFYATDLRSGTAVGAYFAGGAALWHLRRMLPSGPGYAIGALACFAALATYATGNGKFVSSVAGAFLLPYGVVTLAQSSALRLPDAGRWGDFSYGLYLYAFPIQQLLTLHLKDSVSPSMLVLLALVLTLPCAILSWHLVEKHALALKPKARRAAHPPFVAPLPMSVRAEYR